MPRLLAFQIAAMAAGLAVVLAYVLSRLTEQAAWKWGILDLPKGGRKIHTKATPLLGGVGIALAILFSLGIFFGFSSKPLMGYAFGVSMLLIGGILDDRRSLPPWVQVLFPLAAAIGVIATETSILQVTHPFARGGFSLVWWQWLGVSFPSDMITLLWLLLATYATKMLDGLDGLVTGLTVIGSGLVGALSLSFAFFQPSVALLAAIVGGSFLGFLPRNLHPAKQFLGESGATIAGFSLGFLAILSGAKIAIALAVLAIPIADATLVVIGRLRRGDPWYRGDATHLHFRLLKAGLPHGATVFLLWGVSLLAGILALSLQTRGKVFLISGLIVWAAFASYIAGIKAGHPKRQWTDIRIGSSVIRAEIVDTPESRSQGLSGRLSMSDTEGMLFVFSTPDRYPFWMKDMKFPLDIVWLEKGVVVDITTLQPPHETQEPAVFTPHSSADRVLELTAGMAEKLGMKKGQKIMVP